MKKINLHEPIFDKQDFKSLKNCFDSGWIAAGGSFENKFDKIIKINNGRGVDWTDLILTNHVSDWAIKTTIAWFGLTENEWKLKC